MCFVRFKLRRKTAPLSLLLTKPHYGYRVLNPLQSSEPIPIPAGLWLCCWAASCFSNPMSGPVKLNGVDSNSVPIPGCSNPLIIDLVIATAAGSGSTGHALTHPPVLLLSNYVCLLFLMTVTEFHWPRQWDTVTDQPAGLIQKSGGIKIIKINQHMTIYVYRAERLISVLM